MKELFDTALIQAFGIAVLTTIIMEGVKRGIKGKQTFIEDWLPLTAVLVGVALGVAYAIFTQSDIIVYVGAGILGGGHAGGLYDNLTKNGKENELG